MKILSLFALLLLVTIYCSVFISAKTSNNNITFPPLVNLVSTTIGTGGFGFGTGEVNPGAQVPFGCMRLGPDTSLGLEPFQLRIENYGGYYYGDNHIEGFSHTHTVGAGASDYQNFLVTTIRVDPSVVTSPSSFPSNDIVENAGYKSKFSHDEDEVAKPGYYSVNLQTPNVFAEVTAAGTHSGMHRYTCNSNKNNNEPCAIVFDICHVAAAGFFGPYEKSCKSAQIYNWTLDPVTKSKFTLSATMTMAGSLTGRSSRNGGVPIYFYAELTLSEETSAAGVTFSQRVFSWEDKKYSTSTASSGSQSTPTTSASLGMIVVANTTASSSSSNQNMNHQFLLRTGISFISAEYAKQNMLHDQQQVSSSSMKSFDQIATKTIQEWEETLSRFTISAPTNVYSEPVGVFYSLVYRTHLAPTTFSEYDGSYLGMDYNIHKVQYPQTRFFTDLSIWDIYRADVAWQTFSVPNHVHDIALSMLQMQQQYQKPPLSARCKLPKWPIANVESNCMEGSHSSSVILDAINKNISWLCGFDPKIFEHAFDVVADCILEEVQSSMPAPGYYVVGDAGKTLEYGIDAGSVYYTARKNNKNISVANIIRPYATESYKNLFEMTNLIPCPRKTSDPTDQSNFDCPKLFDKIVDWIPYPFESRYVEASAVDSRWIAPQDLDGLFDLLGGKHAAAVSLESFFYNTFHTWPLKNTTLQNPWMDITNEPTMLIPYLFCMCGPQYASRTSYYVQKLLSDFYFYGPAGAAGNTDFGGLDAFAAFGYLGIYPVIPTTNYTIFTPVFDRVTVNSLIFGTGVAPSGSNLTILCSNRTESAEHNYVASVKINGKDIGSRAWFSHEELFENSSPSHPRSALIEMVLSPVPVTVGNPNIPPFVPENDREFLEKHVLHKTKYEKEEQEMIFGQMLKHVLKQEQQGSQHTKNIKRMQRRLKKFSP